MRLLLFFAFLGIGYGKIYFPLGGYGNPVGYRTTTIPSRFKTYRSPAPPFPDRFEGNRPPASPPAPFPNPYGGRRLPASHPPGPNFHEKLFYDPETLENPNFADFYGKKIYWKRPDYALWDSDKAAWFGFGPRPRRPGYWPLPHLTGKPGPGWIPPHPRFNLDHPDYHGIPSAARLRSLRDPDYRNLGGFGLPFDEEIPCEGGSNCLAGFARPRRPGFWPIERLERLGRGK